MSQKSRRGRRRPRAPRRFWFLDGELLGGNTVGRFGRVTAIVAEHLPVTVAGHPSGHDDGAEDDPVVDPRLDVGRVRVPVGERDVVEAAAAEHGDFFVDPGADPGDGRLRHPGLATQRTDQVVDLPRARAGRVRRCTGSIGYRSVRGGRRRSLQRARRRSAPAFPARAAGATAPWCRRRRGEQLGNAAIIVMGHRVHLVGGPSRDPW